MSDERIKKAYDLAEKYGTAERECRWHESGLDADDCFRDLMIYVKGLVARIAELEAEVTKGHELQDSYCDRIAELEAAQRWIPVGERLPKPYTRVLACIKSGYMEVDYTYSEPIVHVGLADFYSLDNVTHWMPLPQPPEVKE